MPGNDTTGAMCEFHCAHCTGENKKGMFVEMYCCWCNKKIDVAITIERLPLPGHGCYSQVDTIVYGWPPGWDIRQVSTTREATSEDALALLNRFNQIKHINLEDEAQRLAMLLFQEGYVLKDNVESD